MKNKILWKNLIWNCTIYFWYRWKYRHSPHRKFFAPLRYWTEREKIKAREKISKSIKKFLRNKVEKRNNKGKQAESKFIKTQQKLKHLNQENKNET